MALAIQVAKGKSYSDVFLGIQEKVNPDDHRVAVRNVTKTRDGNVLIEIGKTDNGTEAFQVAITSALGDSGTIRSLVPKLSVEIRNLDVGTCVTDVEQALKRDLSPLNEVSPRDQAKLKGSESSRDSA